MTKWLKCRKGATIIILVIMMTILFPILMAGITDVSVMYRTSKRLKISLNAACKSASTKVDWNQAAQGNILIDTPAAQTTFKTIFDLNMQITGTAEGSYYTATSVNNTDLKVYYYSVIYNENHKGTYASFPAAGNIPSQVTSENIAVSVDRPTVLGVASVKYKLSPLFGGRVIDITQVASSQLNFIPQDKQKSATYTP